jgi:hypothetical protein
MKRIIYSLLLSFIAVSSFAQWNIYQRMFQVNNGKVRTIVLETTGEVYTFDRKGRINSYLKGTYEIKYSWSDNKVTLAAYQNGKKLEEAYLTVTKNTPDEVSISLPGGTVTETYRANGSEDKAVANLNGQLMVETCFYHSESENSPYKYTISMHGQTETFEISGYKFDAKGNWTKQTLKNNGQSQTEIRTITYYD